MSTKTSTTTLLQLPMNQHVGNNKSMFSRNIQKYQASLNFKILFQNNPYYTSLLCSGSLNVILLRFGKVVLQTSIGFSMSSLQILQNGNFWFTLISRNSACLSSIKKNILQVYLCIYCYYFCFISLQTQNLKKLSL